jgi:hypothetical protein
MQLANISYKHMLYIHADVMLYACAGKKTKINTLRITLLTLASTVVIIMCISLGWLKLRGMLNL